VSKAETLTRLNRLLERVRTRAGGRDSLTVGAAQATAEPVAPEPVEEPVQLSTWTPPPPDDPAAEMGIAVDVDYVETTQISVADGLPESGPSSRLDSAERLVAAGTAPTDSAGEEGSDRPSAHPAEARGDGGQATQSAPDAFDEEGADPAPASSRRPVMPEPEDRLEQMAFGAEEARPPLHTPPPESGRVPAAPADDFDSDAPQMRDGAERPDEPLLVEATRAVLPSFATVAELTGDANRSMPMTFSSILDEALSL
jgi:hypothetical protein